MITVKEQEKLLNLISDFTNSHASYMIETINKESRDKFKIAQQKFTTLSDYIRSLTFTAQIGE